MKTTEKHLEDAVKAAQEALDLWRANNGDLRTVENKVSDAVMELNQARRRIMVHMGD